MDRILDFNKEYQRYGFKWETSSLYQLLCEYYGISDVLIETSYGMIVCKKYNVVGHRFGDDYITLYESIGELDSVISVIYLYDIHSITVLL